MPISIREQVLAAFFDLFSGLTAYPLKKRMPNWVLEPAELPALIQIDGGGESLGGDDVSSGISGTMRVALRVVVIAGIRTASTDELGPALTAARADIIKAVGVSPTLGGLVEHVRWVGDDDPIMVIEQGGPPAAVFPIAFAIIMHEAELDPFSLN